MKLKILIFILLASIGVNAQVTNWTNFNAFGWQKRDSAGVRQYRIVGSGSNGFERIYSKKQVDSLIANSSDTSLVNSIKAGFGITISKGIYFGDSITKGIAATSEDLRWTTLFSGLIGISEDNRGISGATMEKRTPAFSAYNMVDLIPEIPEYSEEKKLLSIAFGTNDAGSMETNYTVLNFKTDYQTVMDAVIAKGWPMDRVLLLSPYYVTPTGFTTYATNSGNAPPDRTRFLNFIQATKDISVDNGALYYNIDSAFALLPTPATYISGDGVHPNDVGMAFIANKLYSFLSPLLNNEFTIAVDETVIATKADLTAYVPKSGATDLTGNFVTANNQYFGFKDNASNIRNALYADPSNNIKVGNVLMNDLYLDYGSGRDAIFSGNYTAGSAVLSGSITMNNTQPIKMKRGDGTPIDMLRIDGSDNQNFGNVALSDMYLYAGSGKKFYFSGDINAGTNTLTMGLGNFSDHVTLNNAKYFAIKNSSGSARNVLYVDGSNNQYVGNVTLGVLNLDGSSVRVATTPSASTDVVRKTDLDAAISGVGSIYQPLENQRLSTTNSPTFSGETLNSTGGAVLAIQKNSAGLFLIGADNTMFGGSNNDATAFVYGNNKFHIATNGSRQVTVTGAGAVGIGTSSPTQALDVTGSIRTTNSLYFQSSSNLISSDTYDMHFITGTSGTGDFDWTSNNMATRTMKLDYLGNLDVRGTLKAHGTVSGTAGTDSLVVISNGLLKKVSPTYYNSGSSTTNLALGTPTSTTYPITNSNGTGFTLPSATTSVAGLFSATDKTILDGASSSSTSGSLMKRDGSNEVAVANIYVTDATYGSGWNGNNTVPTKNAIWDKIETMGAGSSGTYTPTVSNATNCSDFVISTAHYIRVGNEVTVQGRLRMDYNGSNTPTFNLSLPISSSLSSAQELSGLGSINDGPNITVTIIGDGTNDAAYLGFTSIGAGSDFYLNYSFTYTVI